MQGFGLLSGRCVDVPFRGGGNWMLSSGFFLALGQRDEYILILGIPASTDPAFFSAWLWGTVVWFLPMC